MKKQQLFILFLFGNLLIVFFMLASMYKDKKVNGQGSATALSSSTPTAPSNTENVPPVCYTFLVSGKDLRDNITYLLDEYQINNYNVKAVDGAKHYQLFWSLGSDKKMADLKLQDLKNKGIMKNPEIRLSPMGKEYVINMATFNTDKEAIAQVTEMSAKAATLGGRWGYMPASPNLYEIGFNTNQATWVSAIQQKFPTVTVKGC